MQKQKIIARMDEHYGSMPPELDFSTDYELLIAVMLSAQCTDVRVNVVTKQLFVCHNTPASMVELSAGGLEKIIHSCGLAKTKAKNILQTSKILLDEYQGQVPQSIESLQKLPGVGRKTANVVASVAFKIPAIAVDTHVFRVSNRLGIANAKNVYNTEKQLMELIPKDKWCDAHHWLIIHGRRVCKAKKPECKACFLSDLCHFATEKTED